MTMIKFDQKQEYDDYEESDDSISLISLVKLFFIIIIIIFCWLVLFSLYMWLLNSLVDMTLTEDATLSLDANYEFCKNTSWEEYKKNFIENYLKDVDREKFDYDEFVKNYGEVGYNLHRYGCEKFSDYRELKLTELDKGLINFKDSEWLVFLAMILAIMTPGFVIKIFSRKNFQDIPHKNF